MVIGRLSVGLSVFSREISEITGFRWHIHANDFPFKSQTWCCCFLATMLACSACGAVYCHVLKSLHLDVVLTSFQTSFHMQLSQSSRPDIHLCGPGRSSVPSRLHNILAPVVADPSKLDCLTSLVHVHFPRRWLDWTAQALPTAHKLVIFAKNEREGSFERNPVIKAATKDCLQRLLKWNCHYHCHQTLFKLQCHQSLPNELPSQQELFNLECHQRLPIETAEFI